MRYVVIPDDVEIVDRATGKPVMARATEEETPTPLVFRHRDFVLNNLLGDQNVSKGGGEGIRRVMRVERAFSDCRPGDAIGVEEADYKILRQVVDGLTWHPSFVRHVAQIYSHIEAWEKAAEQDEVWKKKRDSGKLSAVSDPSAA